MIWLIILLFALPVYAQESPDVIVIGGGPAGLACATACAQAGYQTLVCDDEHDDLADSGLQVTNWPGIQPMAWKGVVEELRKEYSQAGGTLMPTQVQAVAVVPGGFQIKTATKLIRSAAIVIATGAHPQPLPYQVTLESSVRILPRLWNTSFLSSNDTVAIIGDNERAFENAIDAALRAKKVVLFLQRRWESSATPLVQTARKATNIIWTAYDAIVGLHGTKDSVMIEYMDRGSKFTHEASWAVISTDWIPNSFLVQMLVRCDSSGAIITSRSTGITSTPGLFACGEVASRHDLSGIAAAAEGRSTSSSVCQFLLDCGCLPQPPKIEVKKPAPSLPAKPAPQTTPAPSQ